MHNRHAYKSYNIIIDLYTIIFISYLNIYVLYILAITKSETDASMSCLINEADQIHSCL